MISPEDEIKSLYDKMQVLERRVEGFVAKGNQKADKVEERLHGLHTRTTRWGMGVFFVSLLILAMVGGAVIVAYI